MTRLEYLQSCSLEELATALCYITDYTVKDLDHRVCEYCIAAETCRTRHNGYIDWLREEWEE